MSGKFTGVQRLVARQENLTNESIAYRAIRDLVQVPGMVRMSPAEVVWAVQQVEELFACMASEPDVQKGYKEFRAHALVTNPSRWCPLWKDLNSDWREAYACGIRAALEPSTIYNPPSTISFEP